MGWHTICKVKKDEVNEFDKERAEFLKKAVTSIVTAYYGDEDNYDFRNNMKSIDECKYDAAEAYMKKLGGIEGELTEASIASAVEKLTAKRNAREEEAAAARKRVAEYEKRKAAQPPKPSTLERMNAERLEREAAEKSSKSEPKPIVVSDFEARQIADEEESAFVEDRHYKEAERRTVRRLSRSARTESEPHEHPE